MHGHPRSLELPIYGAAVIAVRDGRLDLHGAHHRHSWTKLQATASEGASQIILLDDVSDWPVGSEVVIAPTGFEAEEAEMVTVTSVIGKVISFTPPLVYSHLGETRRFGDQHMEFRAEVGLLSRNVVVQGSVCDHVCVALPGTVRCICNNHNQVQHITVLIFLYGAHIFCCDRGFLKCTVLIFFSTVTVMNHLLDGFKT